MVSTRLALIVVGSIAAATFAVQEGNADHMRGSGAQDNTLLMEMETSISPVVKVTFAGRESHYLTLCEVKVLDTNGNELKLLDPKQSSTDPGYNAMANRATDGNLDNKWNGQSCTLTNSEPNPYWTASLPVGVNAAMVGSIVVYNRAGESNRVIWESSRLTGAQVWLDDRLLGTVEGTPVVYTTPPIDPPIDPPIVEREEEEPTEEPIIDTEEEEPTEEQEHDVLLVKPDNPVPEAQVEDVKPEPKGAELPKSEPELKGCYKDASDRAMAGSTFSGDVTPKTCSEFCNVLGFSYFGLQDHHYCFCGGADYGKHGTLTADKCNTPCTSLAGVMCGGKWANSVYKVAGFVEPSVVGKAELKSLGCYKDASDRAMGGNTFSGDVTPETCNDYCSVLGFSYFGLQHYDHCFCGGADYAKLGSLAEHKCNTPCNSLPGAMCGGTWANSVYQVRE